MTGGVTVERELLTVAEAAGVLRIGRTKCYELVAAGVLPTIRIGRAVRIPRRALDGWIAAETVRGSEAPGPDLPDRR